MAHDVFISYASQDKPVADAVCAKLEERGIRCWIAPRDVIPGQNWAQAIVQAIDAASIMVLVFSNHANTSKQIGNEVNLAVQKGVALLPLRIEDVLPDEDLAYFLGAPHWLDAITPPLEEHLEALGSAVARLLGRESAQQTVPRTTVGREGSPTATSPTAIVSGDTSVSPVVLSDGQRATVERLSTPGALASEAVSIAGRTLVNPARTVISRVPYAGWVIAALWLVYAAMAWPFTVVIVFGWLYLLARQAAPHLTEEAAASRIRGAFPIAVERGSAGISGGVLTLPTGAVRLTVEQAMRIEQATHTSPAGQRFLDGTVVATNGRVRIVAAYDEKGGILFGTS